MDQTDGLTELRHASHLDADIISSLTIDQRDEFESPDSPLLPHIHFSRAFVPTYYIFAALVIVIGTVVHWRTRKIQKKRLRRVRTEDTKSPASSSSASSSSASSTLAEEEQSVPKHASFEERTPLIAQRNTPLSGQGFVTRLTSRVTALCMYQPRPIPAITARSNQLPTNGASFLILLWVLVNAFYLVYNIPTWDPIAFAFVFAGRAGLCFVANLPVLYLLGAKNNQPLKWLAGWTYERINIYHRRLGEWMIFLAVIHLIGMVYTWYNLLRPVGLNLRWFLSLPIIILGLVALLSYLMIWITSIGYVREKAYEFFLASHIIFQTIALVVLTLHNKSTNTPYCAAALAIWVLDRGVSRILVSNRKFVATLEIAADEETILLYCDIPINRSKWGDIRSGWKAGQHVFLTVPGIAWHHAFQAHPFTIASPAPPIGADGMVWQMQLIIRPMDGFSKELLEYAKLHQHTEIFLDGPYGSTDIVDDVLSADRVCLVAGGSGVTLTYPLAWSSYTGDQEVSTISSRTVYDQGKKVKPQITLHSPQPGDRRAHLWIRQSPKNSSWITRFPGRSTDQSACLEASQFRPGVDLVSQTFETRHGFGGRPDVATEVRRWVEQGCKHFSDHHERVCVVVCGPDGLVRDVRNCAAALTKEGYNIELHVEKFGW